MAQNIDILENISTAVIALDSQLLVTAMNSAAQALFQSSVARTVGLEAKQLVLRPQIWQQKLEQALRGRATVTHRDMVLTLLSGQEIHVDLFLTPTVDSQANCSLLAELQIVDRLLKISRDESMLHTQETTKAVIRSLAHEIKNPLGGVRGAAQLLAKELPSDHLNEYTDIIIKEADRLRDLVDRLLGSREQLTLEPLNIHEVLEHLRNLLNAESGDMLEIVRDYDPSLPCVPGDRSQLIQATLNIMRNAVQAAEPGMRCCVTLKTRAQRQFTIGTKRHPLVCRVDISDNGPGIAKDLMHAVFIPMVSGRANGTGLGLSISQSIINGHGGFLDCTSKPRETTFSIYLPMETKDAK